MQDIFIYRAVFDCLSELLKLESVKAEEMLTGKEQQALREAAEAAEKALRAEQEREKRAVEEAKRVRRFRGLCLGISNAWVEPWAHR